MIKNIFVFLLLTAPTASLGSFPFSTEAREWIDDHFQKSRTLPAHKWVQGYEQCPTDIDQLSELINSYRSHFAKRDYAVTESLYGEMQELLKKKDCRTPLWKAFVVTVMQLGKKTGQVNFDPREIGRPQKI
ncbi:MAG: hypothetical protein AAF203_06990, partial [Pseudomonadota bacterium]